MHSELLQSIGILSAVAFGLAGLVVSIVSLRVSLRDDRRAAVQHDADVRAREREDAKEAMWQEAVQAAHEIASRDGGSVVKEIPFRLDTKLEEEAAQALIAEGRARMDGALCLVAVNTMPRLES